MPALHRHFLIPAFFASSATLQGQVDLLAYIDVFWTLAIIGVLMIPLALIMRPIDLSAPAKGH